MIVTLKDEEVKHVYQFLLVVGPGLLSGDSCPVTHGQRKLSGEVAAGEHGLACTDLAKGEGT